MSSGDPIREYILMNRERYTREAIDTKTAVQLPHARHRSGLAVTSRG